MTAANRQKGDREVVGNGHDGRARGVTRARAQVVPAAARSRRLVLPREIYENVAAGNESFLIRPIMNIHGDLRPVPTRARAQGGHGGLLWAFFPHGIAASDYQLRSCPYGDPNDVLLITTTESKDLPLTVTVLESYPHRVMATTEKFLQGLVPSMWARFGTIQNFYDYWQRHFGRSFKLAQEPWAWVIRIDTHEQQPVTTGTAADDKQGLLGRLRLWRKSKGLRQQKAPVTAPVDAQTTMKPGVDEMFERRRLIAAQKNALACLKNAIEAGQDGRADESRRMMDVAHRILNHAIKKID